MGFRKGLLRPTTRTRRIPVVSAVSSFVLLSVGLSSVQARTTSPRVFPVSDMAHANFGARDPPKLRTGYEGGWGAPGRFPRRETVCRPQTLGPEGRALSGDESVEGERKGLVVATGFRFKHRKERSCRLREGTMGWGGLRAQIGSPEAPTAGGRVAVWGRRGRRCWLGNPLGDSAYRGWGPG